MATWFFSKLANLLYNLVVVLRGRDTLRLLGGLLRQREGLSYLMGGGGGIHQTKRLSQRKVMRIEVRRDGDEVPPGG